MQSADPVTEANLSVCLNCGTPLRGPFCAGCGQRDVPPYPSVRELAVDAISEFSGWDGRLASTLRTLVLAAVGFITMIYWVSVAT